MKQNRRTVRIEWGDCDAAGIVYYPRYFEMFDASTAYLIEAASGLRKRDVIARHGLVGWPMVDTQAKFSKPATFGDDIDIVSEFVELGRSSFKIHHRVYHGEDLAIEAWETRVLVAADPLKPGRMRAAPIPPELLAQFQG
jgi:4-hydroxybenzoyl-CoA thioesterase